MPRGSTPASTNSCASGWRQTPTHDQEDATISLRLHDEPRHSTLAESLEWYSYDLPGGVSKKSWKGRFHGQRQKWFALRFDGDESEIDIETPAGGQQPEFDAWRWESISRLAELIVPFKRPVYEKVVETFSHLAERP